MPSVLFCLIIKADKIGLWKLVSHYLPTCKIIWVQGSIYSSLSRYACIDQAICRETQTLKEVVCTVLTPSVNRVSKIRAITLKEGNEDSKPDIYNF